MSVAVRRKNCSSTDFVRIYNVEVEACSMRSWAAKCPVDPGAITGVVDLVIVYLHIV